MSIKSSLILKKNRDFRVAYNSKHAIYGKSVILFYVKNSNDLRFGFVVSKKVGNAVYRNLAKRRLKAIARELYDDFFDVVKSGNCVFVVKKALFKTNYLTLKKEIREMFIKVEGFI